MGPPSIRHVTELPPTGESGVLYVTDGEGQVTPIPMSDVEGLADALDGKVSRTGAETVAGAKTFTSPVSIPEGTANTHAARVSQIRPVVHEYYMGSNYNLPHDTHRALMFNSVGINGGLVTHTVGNTTSGSSFRVQKAGWWRIEAGLEFGWVGGSEEKRLYITRTGLQVACANTTATVGMLNIARTLWVPTTQLVDVRGFHFSGGNLMMVSGISSTWVTLTYMGD